MMLRDTAWVAEDDLPELKDAFVVFIRWSALAFIGRADVGMVRGTRVDQQIDSFIAMCSSILNTVTCRQARALRVKKAFKAGGLHFHEFAPHDYRGYLGEYPAKLRYREGRFDPIAFDVEEAGINFGLVAIRQLRGSEWERDYSQVGKSSSLLMPSPDLIAAGRLAWDGCGGWLDADGVRQVIDPWWWSGGRGGVDREARLPRPLSRREKQALVVLGFQSKFVAGVISGPGQMRVRTLAIRAKGQTKVIQRLVDRN